MRALPHHGETSQFVRGRRTVIRAAAAILLERLNVDFGSYTESDIDLSHQNEPQDDLTSSWGSGIKIL